MDAIVYGSQQSNSSANGTVASPELATLVSDQGKGGCIVVVPNPPAGFGPAAPTASANRSLGRYPDGADTASLCTDFLTQAGTTLAAASPARATNIKIASVAGFNAGQTVLIDTGTSSETAVIAKVGSAGATTVGAGTAAGTTIIPVASVTGFSTGQAIILGNGADQETAVIAATSRRCAATITVSAPLTLAHATGASVSGTGITFTSALPKAHPSGAQLSDNVPTPGAPNKYSPKRP